jgi:hypothetical protein
VEEAEELIAAFRITKWIDALTADGLFDAILSLTGGQVIGHICVATSYFSFESLKCH